MSNNHQPSRPHSERRRRVRHMRRLGFEALERRACPAVMIDFDPDLGVLNIIGDEGPNEIEIVQRGPEVEVVGAPGGRLFLGTEVGVFLINIHTGVGNDLITVRDGDSINGPVKVFDGSGSPIPSPAIANIPLNLAIDLGTGADYLRVELNNHHNVELGVIAEDGGDVIEAPISINVCQHPDGSSFACGLRASLQLGGGDNDVDIRAQGFGQVDLDVVAAGGGNTVQVVSREFESKLVYSGESGSSCEIDLDFGGGGNKVNVNTRDFDGAALHLKALDGNNVVEHELGHSLGFRHEHIRPETTVDAHLMLLGDGNSVGFQTRGYEQVSLDLDLTGNGNSVEIGLLVPAVQKVREAAARIDLDVGGDSLVDVRLENIDNVDLSLVSDPASPEPVTGGTINVYWHVITNGSSRLGRNDGVVILHSSLPGGSAVPRTPDVSPNSFSFTATAGGASVASALNVALNLGPEEDTVSILTRNVDDLQLDLNTGAGDDTVEVGSNWTNTSGRYLTLRPRPVDHRVSTDAGDGNDSVKYKMLVAPLIHLDADEPRLDAVTLLGAGDDSLKLDASGYGEIGSFLDAGDGHDAAGTRLYVGNLSFEHSPTQLNVIALLGAGDDLLKIDTTGYANVNSLIDGGDGDDEIRHRHKMFALVDRTQLNSVALLGLGSDTLVLETLGYQEIKTSVDTGPEEDGFDTVLARHHSLNPSSHGRGVYQLFLDDGRDVFDGFAVGYAVQEPVSEGAVVEWVLGVELPRA